MNQENVGRFVSVYQRGGDAHIESIELSGSEFETLRALLGNDLEDPMFDCYPIEGHVLERLISMTGNRLLLGDFQYFLETESNETG